MKLKLGKLPATVDPRDFMFSELRTDIPLPKHPKRFGRTNLPNQEWGMDGNDVAGCCVFSSAAHITRLWYADKGERVEFNAETVLSDYSALTGYDPDTGENDNGTNMRQMMNYWRKVGIVDIKGNRHKIGAYVALEPGNIEQALDAMYLFGAAKIGIAFTSAAMGQFNRHEVWDVVRSSPVEGGHDVPLVSKYNYINCVTWGRAQGCTHRFIMRQTDEAYAILSPEMLNGDGVSPEFFDLPTLKKYLRAIPSK